MKKFIITLAIFTGFGALAQQNMTMYNMRSIYQRTYTNPGLLPDAKIYIGIPVLSSQYINLSNSRLDFKGLKGAFEQQPNDSFYLNVNTLANLFKKRNYINLQYDLELINAGIKVGNNCFGANVGLKTITRFSYPGDLLKILLEGNAGPNGQNLGQNFDFSFGMDLMQYTEFGVWYGREHSEKLTFGGRLKYLAGLSNVWLEKGDITFNTNKDDYALNVTTDIKLNMSSTILDPSMIDSVRNSDKPFKQLMSFKNSGLGLDLGAQYYITKRLSASASIIDLGFIKWNSNATTFKSRYPGQTVTYNGVDFNNFFSDSASFEDKANRLKDSLLDRLALDTTKGGYTRSLFTQFYLGGNYHLTKSHNAGILFYGNFHNKRLYPGFTLSWNSKLTRVFSVSASYTIINNTFNNLGLGFSLNGGPYQFYMITDNLINAFVPEKARMANLRFGMGFTIGRDKNEKK